MHRPGIEPGPPTWQASILPLNHRCLLFFKPNSKNISKIKIVFQKKYSIANWKNYIRECEYIMIRHIIICNKYVMVYIR